MSSVYFRIEELVPKHVYELLGDKAWDLIDNDLITTIDQLKYRYNKGSMIINNWLWDGGRQWSGLRTIDSPYYSKTSQHTLGKAIDCVFSHYKVEDVRYDIISNIHLFPALKGIEMDVSWLHIDVRDRETLLQFDA